MLSVVGCLLVGSGLAVAGESPQGGRSLPSQQAVAAVEQRCTGGHTGVAVDKVDALVASWAGQAVVAGSDPKKQLSDAFQHFRDEVSLPPIKAAYATCVERGVSQLLDQPRGDSSAQAALIDGSLLPTKDDTRTLEKNCPGNDTLPGGFRGKVDTAVDDWLTRASTGSVRQADHGIDSAFDPIAREGSVSPHASIYLTCLKGQLHKFLAQAQERPTQVDGSASSAVLSRAAFASDQAMWSAGCKEAETAAVEKLRASCGGRVFLLQNSQCIQGEGESRAYTAQVFGECRVK